MKSLKVDRLSDIRKLYRGNVGSSRARFDIALDHGEGSCVFDVAGRRYLDLGAGLGACVLGHAHPEINDALLEQSRKLLRVSDLYFSKPQAQLAEALVRLVGPGRCFFYSGAAEANSGLLELARNFGASADRMEILTTTATAGRSLSAGVEVPFNDLEAIRTAITPRTAAIRIQAIQSDGAMISASPGYLAGVRSLCRERELLLLVDESQAGHFRTGHFQGWQRVLEDSDHSGFLPDAVSMANALGGGFPIGACWVSEKYAGLLSSGTDVSTFGGDPLGCVVALKVLEIIERDHLAENAREIGAFIVGELQRLIRKFPGVLKEVRGVGLMIGIEFRREAPGFAASEKAAALQVVERLHAAAVLTIAAGDDVVRLLPPLNLTRAEAMEGLHAIEAVVAEIAK